MEWIGLAGLALAGVSTALALHERSGAAVRDSRILELEEERAEREVAESQPRLWVNPQWLPGPWADAWGVASQREEPPPAYPRSVTLEVGNESRQVALVVRVEAQCSQARVASGESILLRPGEKGR